MLHLGHIELFVRDPVQALTFYRDVLGFELTSIQADRFVWLKSGAFELLLRPAGNTTPAARFEDAGQALVLYTDDLEATAALLRQRGLDFKGTDGDGCLTFTDPDGHWFQLVNLAH
ncbi:MAG: VOC family protein [Anaerolineae bacterium]|nr:VOC family protein [Anaerolineae bacterium]